MERYSYTNSLSKRALRIYEDCSEVKAWYDEISALKSARTVQDYIDSLAGFLKDVGKDPSELVKLSSKEVYSLMKRWAINRVQSKSVTVGRIYAIWFGVKSFFKFHEIDVKGEFPPEAESQIF